MAEGKNAMKKISLDNIQNKTNNYIITQEVMIQQYVDNWSRTVVKDFPNTIIKQKTTNNFKNILDKISLETLEEYSGYHNMIEHVPYDITQ
ncbi:hypothetical protein BpHYR1_017002 [Brachionus plicatilis]|uniref:Uncharacterized protein n=1 Tax=Brachionus plicatilis TaxID=10195 RepID=A0A3M7Q617_BRAPC|nr:hypothetical protein BpHYR1_017002 [Brachionus plicatilis]